MKHTNVLVLSFLLSLSVTAAELGKGVIVRFQQPMTEKAVLQLLESEGATKVEALVPSLGIYRIEFKMNLSPASGIRSLQRNQLVRYAQPNHKVKLRNLPNDPKFSTQENLNGHSALGDIGMPKAWDIGTGGKDKLGNDIVIAVVDGGTDLTHSDLKDNLWTNPGEIAGNGIDDDHNGYVDDVNGWDALADTAALPTDPYEIFHGTHVAGIVGAMGNNGAHVAGINWKAKILPIVGATGDTALVAKAYGYVIALKKAYLESHGSRGANIVVTNSSFGVDLANCHSDEFLLWNDLYDQMGKLGILSAVATANQDLDIDSAGDVPSGCDSKYLITVTNTTSEDVLYEQAGFGRKTIQLGAPGTEILSTVPGNKTARATGTSMATPHVTGAVALLHHVASLNFDQAYKADPSKAALELKSILLQSVDKVASLKDKTVTGGRLNVFKAADTISKY